MLGRVSYTWQQTDQRTAYGAGGGGSVTCYVADGETLLMPASTTSTRTNIHIEKGTIFYFFIFLFSGPAEITVRSYYNHRSTAVV